MSITTIGLDTAKSVFQIHGVDETGNTEIRRKLSRNDLIPFFRKQELCTVVLEACGAAHHWARILTGLGHDVKLIAPEAVKPLVLSSVAPRSTGRVKAHRRMIRLRGGTGNAMH